MLGKGERIERFQKGQEVAYSDILDRLRKMMKRILRELVGICVYEYTEWSYEVFDSEWKINALRCYLFSTTDYL